MTKSTGNIDCKTTKPTSVCFIMLKAYPLFNPEVKSTFGGAEVDFYFLATELAKDKNYQVSCIVADYGQEAVETRQDVKLIKSLDFEKNMLLGAWKLWKGLSRADAEIYVRELSSLVTVVGQLFAKCHGRKFVYRTAHSNECDGTYLRENRFRGRAFAWALRNTDIVIAQNEEDTENLSKTIGVSARVIRNAHTMNALNESERDTILWVARSDYFKCPELFLKLAELFPDQKFTMICPKAVSDNHYDDLTEKAERIRNLEFIGRVPFGEIGRYFERARVFVSTSDSEGFPNTFVQACKCATPILSLKVNPDDFLNKHKCGLCANADWNLFADMLKQLISTDRGAELGQNGRKYAEENHDIKKIILQYKAVFKEIGKE